MSIRMWPSPWPHSLFPLLTSLSHVRTRWWSGGGYGGEFDGVKEKICSGDEG